MASPPLAPAPYPSLTLLQKHRQNESASFPSPRPVSLYLVGSWFQDQPCTQNLRLSSSNSLCYLFFSLFLLCHQVSGENEIKDSPLSLIHSPSLLLPVGPLSRLDPGDFSSFTAPAQLPLVLTRMMVPQLEPAGGFKHHLHTSNRDAVESRKQFAQSPNFNLFLIIETLICQVHVIIFPLVSSVWKGTRLKVHSYKRE